MKIKLLTLFIFIVSIAKQSQAQIIMAFAGDSVNALYGDGGPATNALLSTPVRLAIDALGNTYITDQGHNAVRKVNSNGIISTFATGLIYPNGIAIDLLGNVYVSIESGSLVKKINTSGVISIFAGNTTGILGGYYGNGVAATAAVLYEPKGMTADAAGNIYFAEALNNVIRKVNTNGIINTVAGDTIGYAIGITRGYSGDGGQATNAKLNFPVDVVLDPAGNMYIADQNNNVVRKVNTAGIISTFAGNGTGAGTFCSTCYGGDGGQATNAKLNQPTGLTLDASGNLYISDAVNNRIRIVNTNGIISTFAGNGIAGYSGNGGLATNAKLNMPCGLARDSTGNIYVVDSLNNLLRRVCFNSCPATTGIEQFANTNEQVNIYPNPNNGSFVIEPQNTWYNVHCTMYDVNGKSVLSQTITGKTSIDAGSLSEGVYNISIINNEGVVNKRLVIVK